MVLKDSRTTVRTHFVAADINGAIVTDQLADAMARHLLDYAIPRSRMDQAMADYVRTGSSSGVMALRDEAKDLLVKSNKSGEGGELLLYMLMEQVLGYPQILSKMTHKTASQMHVHGADGVHAQLAADGVLDLYWGESKLYQDSSAAFKECLESIAPFLVPENRSDRNRDLMLVRQDIESNVNNDALAAVLVRYFDDKNPESMQVRWNAVCLVGFDISTYPNVSKATEKEREAIARRVAGWQGTVLTRVTENKLLEINIDLFCIPFPSVEKLRAAVNNKIGVI